MQKLQQQRKRYRKVNAANYNLKRQWELAEQQLVAAALQLEYIEDESSEDESDEEKGDSPNKRKHQLDSRCLRLGAFEQEVASGVCRMLRQAGRFRFMCLVKAVFQLIVLIALIITRVVACLHTSSGHNLISTSCHIISCTLARKASIAYLHCQSAEVNSQLERNSAASFVRAHQLLQELKEE
eukprot:scaffold286868_cov15-Tisochrysis_lutea.AAC.1